MRVAGAEDDQTKREDGIAEDDQADEDEKEDDIAEDSEMDENEVEDGVAKDGHADDDEVKDSIADDVDAGIALTTVRSGNATARAVGTCILSAGDCTVPSSDRCWG